MSLVTTKHQHILLFDGKEFADDIRGVATLSFGETLLHALEKMDAHAALYFWPEEQVVYLGMMDTKTPHLLDGVMYLQQQGYPVVVRSAGGLAVVSDSGVLNMTLLLRDPHHKWSIEQGYQRMQHLITTAFPETQHDIKAYEISDSYCPGAYDLSINGKKFAGMAQRRHKDTISISIYLSVCGNQEQRGILIKEFYERALRSEQVPWKFPTVRPDSMATLSELLEQPLTITDVKSRIIKNLQSQVQPTSFDAIDSVLYQKNHQRLLKRNEIITHMTRK